MTANDIVALFSQHRFEEEIQLLHSGWDDLTAATVLLYLHKPTGIETSYSASVDTTDLNLVYYEVAATILDITGEWFYYWKVTKTSVTEYTAPVHFMVYDPRKG